MRAKIYQAHNLYGKCWAVKISDKPLFFECFEDAHRYMSKTLKRMYKEASAFSMARTVSANMLNLAEKDLVRKLCRNKCKGITPKQFGYLKGIHERQQREW